MIKWKSFLENAEDFIILGANKSQPIQVKRESYDHFYIQTRMQKSNDVNMLKYQQNEPMETQPNLDSSKSLISPTIF